MQAPFIKKFKTGECHYIYDINTNQVFKVDPIIYDIIEDALGSKVDSVVEKFKNRYHKPGIVATYKELEKAREEHGLFSTHRPIMNSGMDSEAGIKTLMDGNLKQLILELTENCNYRCGYCSVPGRHWTNRARESMDMPTKIALQAVDFFIERSGQYADGTPAAITFYGGEPLLRFDLVREVVNYVESKGAAPNYRFSFTTNGSLLTREVVEFLVEKNISILISLDGPRQVHDKYRVYPNGEGTYNQVVSNLRQIESYSKKYFENHISFTAVVCPPYDFDSLIDFFYHNPVFSKLRGKVGVNLVDSCNTSFIDDFHLGRLEYRIDEELEALLNRYENALVKGTYEELTIERQFFLEDFNDIENRLIEPLGERRPPLGQCIPGERRLFVNTHGKFYMCERVGSNYEIGSAANGFDYSKILDFYREHDLFFKDCRSCWALRLCKKCFCQVRREDKFNKERKEKMCKDRLKWLERKLVAYCSIKEKNPDAFDILRNVKFV